MYFLLNIFPFAFIFQSVFYVLVGSAGLRTGLQDATGHLMISTYALPTSSSSSKSVEGRAKCIEGSHQVSVGVSVPLLIYM